jgi:hypothetical protein
MSELLTKQITVLGEKMTVFSCDGWRWSSDPREAEDCQKRSEIFWNQSRRSMKRTATFAHNTQRIVRD